MNTDEGRFNRRKQRKQREGEIVGRIAKLRFEISKLALSALRRL